MAALGAHRVYVSGGGKTSTPDTAAESPERRTVGAEAAAPDTAGAAKVSETPRTVCEVVVEPRVTAAAEPAMTATGTSDAGAADVGSVKTGAVEAGAVEAGAADAGAAQAGAVETGAALEGEAEPSVFRRHLWFSASVTTGPRLRLPRAPEVWHCATRGQSPLQWVQRHSGSAAAASQSQRNKPKQRRQVKRRQSPGVRAPSHTKWSAPATSRAHTWHQRRAPRARRSPASRAA